MTSSQTFTHSGPGDPGSNLAGLALFAEQHGLAFTRISQPDLLMRVLWKNACWLVLLQRDNQFQVLAEGSVDEVTRSAAEAAANALSVLGIEVHQGGFDISNPAFKCPRGLPEFPATDVVMALLTSVEGINWLRQVNEQLTA